MTDQELLRAFVDGRDEESLGAFVVRYQHSVLRFVCRLLGDPETAQDVVQETFLEVARHPKRLLRVESCHNWLLRVARNIGMDHLRRRARQQKHTRALAEQRLGNTSEAAPVTALECREVHEQVCDEIERLSPRHRELLLLRIQERKSYREIAEITGLSATNVGFILHQAMKTLSHRLRRLGEGYA